MKNFKFSLWLKCVNTLVIVITMFPTLTCAQTGVVRAPITATARALWSDRVIEVCWENPLSANATERTWVQNAVLREWENNSNVRFVGWNACTGDSPGIRIGVADETPHTKSLGARLDGDENGMVLNFTFNHWMNSCADGGDVPPGFAGFATHREYCIRAVAVHEFGHALGFTHEHNRKHGINFDCRQESSGSTGSWLITPYDEESVMNYCNDNWNGHGHLSHLDIVGLQKAYGAPGQSLNQDPRWYVSYGGQTNWVMINTSRIPLKELGFGDFNGDGRTDVFNSRNGIWYVSYGGTGPWTEINRSEIKLEDLRFGHFNGNIDRRTDVFNSRDDIWYVSYGGTGPWTRINRSEIRLRNLRLGDFDGDGRTDVFNSRNGIWYVSYGGTGPWTEINRSEIKLGDLRFGHFVLPNGLIDRRTDVFNSRNDNWWVSYSGTGPWTQINRSDIKLKDLHFGYFNSDRNADVFYTDGKHFYFSWDGTTPFHRLFDTALVEDTDIALGDFDGDGITDVFVSW